MRSPRPRRRPSPSIATFAERVGTSLLALLWPGSASLAGDAEHTRLHALAARGDVHAALARYESIVRARPGDSIARLHAAELYLVSGDARRAESLLREVQRHPARTDAHELRASNRLVDLYLGPLAEPESARRELQRLADMHAGTPVGEDAVAAISRLRS